MASLAQPFEDVFCTSVSHAPFFVDRLFRRKFGGPAPDYGRAVVAFYRKDWHHFVPLCYANFLPYDEVLLGGGAMTDEFAFRMMPKTLFGEIKREGGVYVPLLRFAINLFGDDCEAFFGYAGDALAYKQDIAAGFEPTGFKHLLVHFHKPLPESRKRFLIGKVNEFGPF